MDLSHALDLITGISYLGIGMAFVEGVRTKRLGLVLGGTSFLIVATVFACEAITHILSALDLDHQLIIKAVYAVVTVLACFVVVRHVAEVKRLPRQKADAAFDKFSAALDDLRHVHIESDDIQRPKQA